MEDIPVPIPNTEVKLHSAESSWGIAPCEGRTLPCKLLRQPLWLAFFLGSLSNGVDDLENFTSEMEWSFFVPVGFSCVF